MDKVEAPNHVSGFRAGVTPQRRRTKRIIRNYNRAIWEDMYKEKKIAGESPPFIRYTVIIRINISLQF
jgi:hypothetical protein